MSTNLPVINHLPLSYVFVFLGDARAGLSVVVSSSAADITSVNLLLLVRRAVATR
jgi:hypothetical protein